MTILAPRMLISLRREYYKAITGTEPGSLAQPVFQRPSPVKRREGKDAEKGKDIDTNEVVEVPRTLLMSDVVTSNQSKVLGNNSVSHPDSELDEPGVKIDNLF